MIGDNAYNTELYKRKKCKGKQQEDYCTPVYEAWCNDNHLTNEHQKDCASGADFSSETQSSSKPKQMA